MSDLDVHDDPELREALHAAVAGGPPDPGLDDLLTTARRARRVQGARRAVGAVALAAAVACAAVTGAHLVQAPGGGDRTGIAARADRAEEPHDLGVRVTDDGRLRARSGTTVLRTVEDPLDRAPRGRSWGVVVQGPGGDELWGLVDRSAAGTMSSVEPARDRFAAFEDWLDYEVSSITGEPQPHPVAFEPDGALRPTGAVRIVQEGEGVDLGPAPEGTMTAAAELDLRGERQFVLARLAPGRAPQYVVLAPQGPASTFEQLVGRAAELFAAGEPVR